jgi:hypothetical protein
MFDMVFKNVKAKMSYNRRILAAHKIKGEVGCFWMFLKFLTILRSEDQREKRKK